jgi:hypothetical protein
VGCPTVKVKCENEQGFMIINESDFDSGSQEVYTPKVEAKAKTEAEPKVEAKAKKDDK